MGNYSNAIVEIDNKDGESTDHNLQSKYRMISSVRLTQNEVESMCSLLNRRKVLIHENLCTVRQYSLGVHEDSKSGLGCQQFKEIKIYYENFENYLSDIVNNAPMSQKKVEKIIYSVCQALKYMQMSPLKARHGDICPKMICCTNRGEVWKLIDNCFVKGGITAYEQVLQGEEGFVTPQQMKKIRHGFVQQSPPISEADDVFGLGMTCLQIMSGRPSKHCYSDMYIRFNEDYIVDSLAIIKTYFTQSLNNLVRKMLNYYEQERPTITEILKHEIITQHSNKKSIRNTILQKGQAASKLGTLKNNQNLVMSFNNIKNSNMSIVNNMVNTNSNSRINNSIIIPINNNYNSHSISKSAPNALTLQYHKKFK